MHTYQQTRCQTLRSAVPLQSHTDGFCKCESHDNPSCSSCTGPLLPADINTRNSKIKIDITIDLGYICGQRQDVIYTRKG